MKSKLLLLSIGLLGVHLVVAQVINFKDPIFLSSLIRAGVDSNNNLKIELEEALSITKLAVNTSPIRDMTGIEFFVNLIYLDVAQTDIKKLDLSTMSKLQFLNCSQSDSLSTLIISNCLDLDEFDCSFTMVGNLDVSKFVKLRKFDCALSRRSELDVSKNLILTDLICLYNRFNTIDLSNNSEITYLDASAGRITSLDVSKNPKLTFLDVTRNTGLSTICVFDTNYAKSNPKFKKDPSQSWTQNCFPTGFEELSNTSTSIGIYPNPALDNLKISGEVKDVKIYSTNGTMVLNGNSNNYHIGGLPQGIYQVHVVLNDGQSQVRKFVKE